MKCFISYRTPKPSVSSSTSLSGSEGRVEEARAISPERRETGKEHDETTPQREGKGEELATHRLRPAHTARPKIASLSELGRSDEGNGSSPVFKHKNEAKFAAENQSSIQSSKLRKPSRKNYKQ